jgi:pyrroloquinoline quinone (PQQ) biosynthesis protein C
MNALTEEFEKEARLKVQPKLSTVVPRDLLPNGSYAPLPGIYDIAWKEWMDLPAADFVREMRKLDDSITDENEEWVYRSAPMVERGELTLDQLKRWELRGFSNVDGFSISIVRHVFRNLGNKEVRDIILRHAAEEVGHSEIKADFLVTSCGYDRVRDVWGSQRPSSDKRHSVSAMTRKVRELEKENPVLSYAIIPFLERCLPTMNRMMGIGLRKHYGFESKVLAFYDLHTYVDIYHERLGLYLLAKYATTKREQQLFREAVEELRKTRIESNRKAYYELIKSK